MELTTISEISRKMNISTRTLRYYEQIGLIESVKKEDYAYRTYDDTTITRLQQILVLRKLRIPLKQIALLLKSEDTAAIIETFQQNLSEVDDEITALSTIRDIINTFIVRLKDSIHQDIKLNLLDDTALLEAVDALTVQKISIKAEKTAVDLEQASEKLSKLTDRDVRIIYLPPMTVAAIQVTDGDPGPEAVSGDMMFDFIKSNNLPTIMPGFRHFGFNNPELPQYGDGHGYERWVTIPDSFQVTKPFVKKYFPGGLYAAHMIPMGAFEEGGWLYEWITASEKYALDWRSIVDGVCGYMEEHLDAPHHYLWSGDECDKRLQLDLLFPIKEKEAK